MKLSIRTKVCLSLAAFTLFCVVTLAVIMMGGFNSYYVQYKKQNMVSTSQEISSIYESQGENGYDEIDQISQRTGADIFIIDNGKLAYSSRPDRRVIMAPPKPDTDSVVTAENGMADEKKMKNVVMQPPRHILEMMELMRGQETKEQEIGNVKFHETGNRIQMLDLVYRIHEHAYAIISQPITPIRDTVAVAKQFALICGILWMVVAVVGALYFSRRLTDPLLKLKEQSAAITKLDFSKKWDDNRNDEIGQLGDSLNRLSEQLYTAMSELQQSNNQLKDQLDKAKEVEHMRRNFISSVSHELKTPLAIIQGYAEGLNEVANDEETRQRYCRVIRSETEKMDHLVKDLLNLSRLETGSFKIEKTDFDFAALVEETKDRFAGAIEEKGIIIKWNVPEGLIVNGDPERIDQILGNYLSNAIDYTDKGKKIEVSIEDKGNTYQINVYNQGIQIDPKDQERLWTAFYKVDSSHTRKFGGHGLGLSIVAALVKHHGQKYGMRNESDGVTFWFTLEKGKN